MTDVYVAYGIHLMRSFKTIPHRLPAARVRTWYLYSIWGLCCIYPAGFENKGNYMQGWGQSSSLGFLRRQVFYLCPVSVAGRHGPHSHLVLMEPVLWIHHISMCILSCFDILMHEITSLGKGLPLLKCSQFPLMIMEKRHIHTPTVAQKSRQNMEVD